MRSPLCQLAHYARGFLRGALTPFHPYRQNALRRNRNAGSSDLPTAWFAFSPDWQGKHPQLIFARIAVFFRLMRTAVMTGGSVQNVKEEEICGRPEVERPSTRHFLPHRLTVPDIPGKRKVRFHVVPGLQSSFQVTALPVPSGHGHRCVGFARQAVAR
ncbi:Uncharacterised protein [Serratia quinivorans]|nr:Uncharacterised protein [Serratia quinivorans]